MFKRLWAIRFVIIFCCCSALAEFRRKEPVFSLHIPSVDGAGVTTPEFVARRTLGLLGVDLEPGSEGRIKLNNAIELIKQKRMESYLGSGRAIYGPNSPKKESPVKGRTAIVLIVGPDLDSDRQNRIRMLDNEFGSDRQLASTYYLADIARVKNPEDDVFVIRAQDDEMEELGARLKSDRGIGSVLVILSAHGACSSDGYKYLAVKDGGVDMQEETDLSEWERKLEKPVETSLLSCHSGSSRCDFPGGVMGACAKDAITTNREYLVFISYLHETETKFPKNAEDFLRVWKEALVWGTIAGKYTVEMRNPWVRPKSSSRTNEALSH